PLGVCCRCVPFFPIPVSVFVLTDSPLAPPPHSFHLSPPAPPTSPSIDVESISATSVVIRWNPNQLAPNTDYSLNYASDKNDWRKLKLSVDQATHVVSGLACGTSYRFYVIASNSLGTGEPGAEVQIRTQGGRLPPALDDLSPAPARLSGWTSVSLPPPRRNSGKSRQKTAIHNLSEEILLVKLSMTVLQRAERELISLLPSRPFAFGRAAPVSPHKQFIVPNTTSATLLLDAWRSTGCPISAFNIQYRKRGNRNWYITGDTMSGSNERYTIAQLSPSTTYEVKVAAMSDAGPTSQDYQFTTLPIGGE
ncbi:Down syndrome cell adhesion molecule protein Dscam2-like, partial [Tropilaelaps mercedesae]